MIRTSTIETVVQLVLIGVVLLSSWKNDSVIGVASAKELLRYAGNRNNEPDSRRATLSTANREKVINQSILTRISDLRDGAVPKPVQGTVVRKRIPNTLEEQKDDDEETSGSTGQWKSKMALIHVGPLKTGSSTIQYYIRTLRSTINSDLFEIPTKHPSVDMGSIRACFLKGQTYGSLTQSKKCDTELMNRLTKIGEGNHYNLLLSAESWSFPNSDIGSMKAYLKRYWSNFVIVMYYRRYYDWLYSSWSQYYKYYNFPERTSFVDYINDLYSKVDRYQDAFYNSHYTYSLLPRWKEHYDNVKVYNVHDERTVSNPGKFFCDAFGPNKLNNTCSELQQLEKQKGKQKSNEAPDLIYVDLAYMAVNQSLLKMPKIKKDTVYTWEVFSDIVKVVQYQQEVVWNLTKYDFVKSAVACIEDESILKDLLQKTLTAEREMFPDYYEEVGSKEIVSKFEKDKRHKLCSIDPTIVLRDDPKWFNFFTTKAFVKAAEDYAAYQHQLWKQRNGIQGNITKNDPVTIVVKKQKKLVQ